MSIRSFDHSILESLTRLIVYERLESISSAVNYLFLTLEDEKILNFIETFNIFLKQVPENHQQFLMDTYKSDQQNVLFNPPSESFLDAEGFLYIWVVYNKGELTKPLNMAYHIKRINKIRDDFDNFENALALVLIQVQLLLIFKQ